MESILGAVQEESGYILDPNGRDEKKLEEFRANLKPYGKELDEKFIIDNASTYSIEEFATLFGLPVMLIELFATCSGQILYYNTYTRRCKVCNKFIHPNTSNCCVESPAMDIPPQYSDPAWKPEPNIFANGLDRKTYSSNYHMQKLLKSGKNPSECIRCPVCSVPLSKDNPRYGRYNLLSHLKEQHCKVYPIFNENYNQLKPYIPSFDGRTSTDYSEFRSWFPLKHEEDVITEIKKFLENNTETLTDTTQNTEVINPVYTDSDSDTSISTVNGKVLTALERKRIHQPYGHALNRTRGTYSNYIRCPVCFVPVCCQDGNSLGMTSHLGRIHDKEISLLASREFQNLKDFFIVFDGKPLTVEQHLEKYPERSCEEATKSIKDFLNAKRESIPETPKEAVKDDSTEDETLTTTETDFSFQEGTQILTEEGLKSIEDVKSGNEILTLNNLVDYASLPHEPMEIIPQPEIVTDPNDRIQVYVKQNNRLASILDSIDEELIKLHARLDSLNKDKYTLIAEKMLLTNILQLYGYGKD